VATGARVLSWLFGASITGMLEETLVSGTRYRAGSLRSWAGGAHVFAPPDSREVDFNDSLRAERVLAGLGRTAASAFFDRGCA